MDIKLFNRLLQILDGKIFDVQCQGESYSFYYKDREFYCETDTHTHQLYSRIHKTIPIVWDDKTFYAVDALILRSPQTLYGFLTLSTTCEKIEYSNILLLLDKTTSSEIKHILNNINLENINYCNCEKIKIKSELIYYEDNCMLKFILDRKVSHEYIVGIALRIAHSICFIFSSFKAAPISILTSDEGYTLTCTGNFNLKRNYTIFIPPHQFDYFHYEKYNPELTKDFIHNFIKLALEKDYFFDIILSTIENSRYDSYTDAIACFVALEKFAQNNAEQSKIPEDWKIIIKEISDSIKSKLIQLDIPDELKNFINNKLNGFFSQLNSERLKIACESIGYKLTDADNKTLGERNKFFHGSFSVNSLPIEKKLEVILRIHRLVCTLLAKKAGYRGFICQYDQFIPTQGKGKEIEDIFRLI